MGINFQTLSGLYEAAEGVRELFGLGQYPGYALFEQRLRTLGDEEVGKLNILLGRLYDHARVLGLSELEPKQ